MKLESNGVRLRKLTLESAQVVREWRNSARVSQFMDFQKEISEEQQRKWFYETQKTNDHYFVIYTLDEPVGLIHLNRMNILKKEAYAGLFIGNESFEGTGITFSASILLLDFAFNELGLVQVFAKVHAQNTVAIEYNKTLGFVIDGEERESFLRLKINEVQFLVEREKLWRLLVL